MSNNDIEKAQSSIKEVASYLRFCGREMVDPDNDKGEKFLAWLMFDQLIVKLNNGLQDVLENLKET